VSFGLPWNLCGSSGTAGMGSDVGFASNLHELTGEERIYCTRSLYLVGFVIHADFGNMGRLLAGLQQ
jgi:hypothetical protein